MKYIKYAGWKSITFSLIYLGFYRDYEIARNVLIGIVCISVILIGFGFLTSKYLVKTPRKDCIPDKIKGFVLLASTLAIAGSGYFIFSVVWFVCSFLVWVIFGNKTYKTAEVKKA